MNAGFVSQQLFIKLWLFEIVFRRSMLYTLLIHTPLPSRAT